MKMVALLLAAGLVGTFVAGQGAVLDNTYVMVRDEVLVAWHGAQSLAGQATAKVGALLTR